MLETDGGYAARVLAEQGHLRAVAEGKRVPVTVPNTVAAAPTAVKVATLFLGAAASSR
jgi:hypothetical protein